MSQCNYCRMKRIERSVKDGEKIVKVSDMGGVSIFVVPNSISTEDVRSWKREPDGCNNRQKYFVSWLMELPGHCCC